MLTTVIKKALSFFSCVFKSNPVSVRAEVRSSIYFLDFLLTRCPCTLPLFFFFFRGLSHPIFYQPGFTRNTFVFPGTRYRPKRPPGTHWCVESYTSLLGWGRARFSGRVSSDLHVLQHDHRVVLLLPVRIIPRPSPVLILSFGP